MWRVVRKSRGRGFVNFGRTIDRFSRVGVFGKRRFYLAILACAVASSFGRTPHRAFVCSRLRNFGWFSLVLKTRAPQELVVAILEESGVIARIVGVLSASVTAPDFRLYSTDFADFSNQSGRAEHFFGAKTRTAHRAAGVFLDSAYVSVRLIGALRHWRFGRA